MEENKKVPEARSSGILVNVNNGECLLFGGGSREGTYNDFWTLNTKDKTWGELKTVSCHIPPRFGCVGVIANSDLYIHGGQNYLESKFYADMLHVKLNYKEIESKINSSSFDLIVKNQTLYPVDKSNITTPCERNSHSIIYDQDKLLYIFGGGCTDGLLNDLWSYDITSLKWNKLDIKSEEIKHREMHGMVYYKDDKIESIYILGGRLYEGIDDKVYRIDINNNKYTSTLVSKMPLPLCSFAYAIYKTFIFIYGGTDGNKFNNEIFIHNILNGKWCKSAFQPAYTESELGGKIGAMLSIDEENDLLVIFGGSFIHRDSNDLVTYKLSDLLKENNLLS